MRGRALALLSIGILAAARPAGAQLAVDNLLDLQAGNQPDVPPSNRTSTYDQFNAQFTTDRLRFGARFEANRNNADVLTYNEFTQRWAEFSDTHLKVRAGNTYTILGRGLLQRAFELPGVVLDQPGFDSRYGFSRDVDGTLIDADWGPLAVRGIEGRPNSGETSPSVEKTYDIPRYSGELIGGQATATVWRGARLGAAYTRFDADANTRHEYASVSADLDPMRLFDVSSVSLPLYVEAAHQSPSWTSLFDFPSVDTDRSPRALYLGSNLLAGPFALAAEWKDYTRFRLGYNDPPSLVREQSFTLLNRTTHVLDADDERGYQIEASVRIAPLGVVTVNQSRADGLLSPSQPPRRYNESYAEIHLTPRGAPALEATLFVDGGKDEFVGIEKRDGYGGTATVRMPRRLSATLDLEYLDEQRPPDHFHDEYASIAIQHAVYGTVALVLQRTTDPAEEKPADVATPGIQPRDFVSGLLSVPISAANTVSLFVGQRREGLACTAGTCYRVEAFQGVEFRLTSRF
ncbi:MAG: hypothetical protein ACHQ52_10825 [Candidatus Eisenbacteria bacterium]